MTMPTSNQAAFDRLATEYLRKEQWTDIEIFALIGSFCEAQPDIARALSFHARDFLQEVGDQDMDYTELVCEIYRRTFFDPVQAAKYGTESFSANEDGHLDHFVTYLITLNKDHVNVIPTTPAYRM